MTDTQAVYSNGNGSVAAELNGVSNGHEDEDYDAEDVETYRKTRHSDGTVKLRNPNIAKMEQDILYHVALGSGSHDLHEMFGDVKFVCMGGTPKRMETFAHFIVNEIGYKLQVGTKLEDISAFSYRYSMYKVWHYFKDPP